MSLRAIEPERVGRAGAIGCVQVGVVVQEVRGEPVDNRRVRGGGEGRFARRVGRLGISTKIMVKGFILPEDHDDVLDRGGGWKRILRRCGECRQFAVCGKHDRQAKGGRSPANVAWHEVLLLWRDETPLPERQKRPWSGGRLVGWPSDMEMTRESRNDIAFMNECV